MKYFAVILVACFLLIICGANAQSTTAPPTASQQSEFQTLKDRIEFFPNPSRGSFKINVKDETLEDFIITIYDLKGTVVFERVFAGLFAGISLDLKLKKPGLYLVKINTDKEQLIEKLLVNP